jgi:YhcH/YjgK/YiaL family protein
MRIMMMLDSAVNFPVKGFEKALRFLETADLSKLQPGTVIPIDRDNRGDGDAVFARVHEYETRPEESIDFEDHSVYYDLHYIVSGTEYICGAKAQGLKQKTAYNAGDDITFYEGTSHYGKFLLNSGEALLIASGEAHRPGCSVDKPEPVRKIVVKIKTCE